MIIDAILCNMKKKSLSMAKSYVFSFSTNSPEVRKVAFFVYFLHFFSSKQLIVMSAKVTDPALRPDNTWCFCGREGSFILFFTFCQWATWNCPTGTGLDNRGQNVSNRGNDTTTIVWFRQIWHDNHLKCYHQYCSVKRKEVWLSDCNCGHNWPVLLFVKTAWRH